MKCSCISCPPLRMAPIPSKDCGTDNWEVFIQKSTSSIGIHEFQFHVQPSDCSNARKRTWEKLWRIQGANQGKWRTTPNILIAVLYISTIRNKIRFHRRYRKSIIFHAAHKTRVNLSSYTRGATLDAVEINKRGVNEKQRKRNHPEIRNNDTRKTRFPWNVQPAWENYR